MNNEDTTEKSALWYFEVPFFVVEKEYWYQRSYHFFVEKNIYLPGTVQLYVSGKISMVLRSTACFC